MVLKVPPVLVFEGYRYFSCCPVCGCVANYRIGYNYSYVFCSEHYRIYSFICLECGSEHCFNVYSIVVNDCMGVFYCEV